MKASEAGDHGQALIIALLNFHRSKLARSRFPRSTAHVSAESIVEKQQQLLDELSLFQDWTERYEYVIGLGKKLSPMADEAKVPEKLIKGCQSQVWLDCQGDRESVRFFADSDSLITKGMIALFVRVLDGEPADAILQADMGFIEKTGLKEHLAPTRANALGLMATQMKQAALTMATESA